MARERTPLGRGDIGRDAERLDVLIGGRAAGFPASACKAIFTKIILIPTTGSATFYNADDTGLTEAETAASSGDALLLPIKTISGDHTISAGIKVLGRSRYATILSGQLTLGNGSSIENLSNIRTANDTGVLKGIVIGDTGVTAYVHDCDVEVTQSGAGNAYGVSIEADDSVVEVWSSYIYGSSGSGSGYGGYRDAGTNANMYIFGGRADGSTGAFSE